MTDYTTPREALERMPHEDDCGVNHISDFTDTLDTGRSTRGDCNCAKYTLAAALDRLEFYDATIHKPLGELLDRENAALAALDRAERLEAALRGLLNAIECSSPDYGHDCDNARAAIKGEKG